MKFKLGDRVKWTSQSHGIQKNKVGIIFHIMKAGVGPVELKDDLSPSSPFWRVRNPGMCRNHESYLVEVEHQRQLYWPRVKYLEKLGKI